MEQLKNAILEARENLTCSGMKADRSTSEADALQAAAEKWAVSSLRTFTGDLLSRALVISAALVEFVNELEK